MAWQRFREGNADPRNPAWATRRGDPTPSACSVGVVMPGKVKLPYRPGTRRASPAMFWSLIAARSCQRRHPGQAGRRGTRHRTRRHRRGHRRSRIRHLRQHRSALREGRCRPGTPRSESTCAAPTWSSRPPCRTCAAPAGASSPSVPSPPTPAAAAQAAEAATSQIPAGRTGQSDNVAAVAAFLASPAAGYISGQVIHVNGGWRFGS